MHQAHMWLWMQPSETLFRFQPREEQLGSFTTQWAEAQRERGLSRHTGRQTNRQTENRDSWKDGSTGPDAFCETHKFFPSLKEKLRELAEGMQIKEKRRCKRSCCSVHLDVKLRGKKRIAFKRAERWRKAGDDSKEKKRTSKEFIAVNDDEDVCTAALRRPCKLGFSRRIAPPPFPDTSLLYGSVGEHLFIMWSILMGERRPFPCAAAASADHIFRWSAAGNQ